MVIAFVFGVFGLIVGSFLNVLIFRWGKRPLTGRSICTSCLRQLRWFELIPVVSWLSLHGRCRTCEARISIQYPLVEAGTGVVFALIGFAPLPLFFLILALPIAALQIAIAVYDLRTTYIPNLWVFALAGLALFSSLVSLVASETLFDLMPMLILGPVGGTLVALPLFAFWFFSGGAWMGFGDVKLALAMGWLLGFSDGLFALFLAFSIGGAVGSLLLFFSSSLWSALRKRFTPSPWSRERVLAYTMKSEVPFGPFLVVATLIVWISHMHGITIGLDSFLVSLTA